MKKNSSPRVIPCLLLRNTGLVKTVKFKDPTYLGDPRNIVRIFNDKEADELALLDITATVESRPPRLDLIKEIASECFMPLAYGGGVKRVSEVEKIIGIGIEKVVINTAGVEDPRLIEESARVVGSQSLVVALDVRKRPITRRYEVCTHSGRLFTGLDPVTCAKRMEDAGAGEILLNSIDRDGTMTGYDLALVQQVATAVRIPVIACGGASTISDFGAAVKAGASAVAAGSIFVFQGRYKAVLISFPTAQDLAAVFAGRVGADQK
jgi:cyclase